MTITKVNLISAKSILTKTNLPGCDYVVNPYNGCQFACIYCYAAQIARWKHPGEEWGSFLDVKTNAPSQLRTDLERLERKYKTKDYGTIWFSSVTDPYTGLEAKYQLTRGCLQTLIDFDYQGLVAIQTKSNLITRDIDLLKKLKHLQVGFTVTSLNDQVSRFVEIMAPPVSLRLKAMEQLIGSGISVYAFIGPLLPHFVNNQSEINKLLDHLVGIGVDEVWFEHINLTPRVKAIINKYLSQHSPQLIEEFNQSDTLEYRQKLNKVIMECLEGRRLKLGLNKIIYHRNLKN